jgi:hypothetical protein
VGRGELGVDSVASWETWMEMPQLVANASSRGVNTLDMADFKMSYDINWPETY